MTVSIENFVKVIYKQSMIPGVSTRISAIAAILNISNAAATDMARKLATKSLVNYTKYKPLSLTHEGKKLALKVLRKHRLWESFLYSTLNLSLHEIHREAEQLEHFTSDFLADKIDEYLGVPSVDPHGDPIPDGKGIIITAETQTILSNALEGNKYEISRLSSSEKDFFDFCAANSISVGTNIWVVKQYAANKMTEITVNKNKLLLNYIFTNDIFVKRIN